jgi:hypothetical protein
MNKGRRYAVLIGSSRFDKEPNLNPLKCPENDVDGMREVLAAVDLGAFEEPSVFKEVARNTQGRVANTCASTRCRRRSCRRGLPERATDQA